MAAYLQAGPADMGQRTSAVCLVYLIAWLLTARELWPGHSRITGAGRKMALAVCLLYALLALARIVHAGWAGAVYDAAAMRFSMFSSLGMHWLSFSFILCALYICYERALEHTQHQASHDGLTNLLNQRGFRELAEAAYRRSWRERSRWRCCSWTWTTSKASTTATAIKAATWCCGNWRTACAARRAPTISSAATAARNS